MELQTSGPVAVMTIPQTSLSHEPKVYLKYSPCNSMHFEFIKNSGACATFKNSYMLTILYMYHFVRADQREKQ